MVGAVILEGYAPGVFNVEDALDAGADTCNAGTLGNRRQASPSSDRMSLCDSPNPFGWVCHNKTAERKRDPPAETTTPVAFLSTYGSGPVTISSRARETKWEAGWVSLFAPGAIEQATAADLEDDVAMFGQLSTVSAKEAGKYKFELYKREERY